MNFKKLLSACDHSRDFAGHWNPQHVNLWWNVEDAHITIPGKIGRIYGPTIIATIEPLRMQPMDGSDGMIGNEESCRYVHRVIRPGRKNGFQVCVQ